MSAGKVKFIDVSVGHVHVWGVDAGGLVYLRIGVSAPSRHRINPAWVMVSGSTHAQLVHVVVNSCDSMVIGMRLYGG